MPRNIIKYLPGVLLIIFYLILQWPFLKADADLHLSESKAPWIDQGLYTFQVRSDITQNDLQLSDSDGLIKTPLFGWLSKASFKIMGIHFWTHRLAVLLLLSAALLFLVLKREWRWPVIFLLGIGFTQNHLFHFMHLGLAEVVVIACMLLSMYFLSKVFSRPHFDGKQVFQILLAAFWLSACYWLKVQYLYLIAIPVAICVLLLFRHFMIEKNATTSVLLKTILALHICLAVFLVLFAIVWYLPNRDLFDYAISTQSAEKYAGTFNEIWNWVRYNYEYNFFEWETEYYRLGAFISLPFLFFYFLKRKVAMQWLIPMLFALILILLDMHKLGMQYYVPSRYLLTMYFAAAILISFLAAKWFKEGKLLKEMSLLILFWFLWQNGNFYVDALQNRNFDTQRLNKYVSQIDLNGRPIAGTWGATVNWENPSRVYPLWNNYFTPTGGVEALNPKLIVIETGGDTSLHALQDMDLHALADSVVTKRLQQYELQFYWMK